MTEIQRQKADEEMNNLWKEFIYEEAMRGAAKDYRHLDMIIRMGYFIKKYTQCDKKICSYWIFIMCDGEFGYFDGYEYYYEIPVALAKLLDLEEDLSGRNFTIENKKYVVK